MRVSVQVAPLTASHTHPLWHNKLMVRNWLLVCSVLSGHKLIKLKYFMVTVEVININKCI